MPSRHRRTPQVLIVEDEPILSFALAAAFEDEGFDVLGPFDRVGEAIQAANRADLTGAVLDIRLSDGTSYPLAHRLEAEGVPLVLVTASSRAEISEQGVTATVLTKPVDPERVVAAMSALVEAAPPLVFERRAVAS